MDRGFFEGRRVRVEGRGEGVVTAICYDAVRVRLDSIHTTQDRYFVDAQVTRLKKKGISKP